MGLIQFGPSEREQYGANENQSFREQLGAVERYLKDRGYKQGMPLRDLYSTILAGRPGLNRADSGGTVNEHVERMKGAHRARALLFLKGGAPSETNSGQDVIPGQGDPHKPGFDPSSVKFHDFHKALDTIRNARPLAPWQQSMNEIHDYRSVEYTNNFHIASASSADMMGGDSLGRRPKNADLIRNTTSYAS